MAGFQKEFPKKAIRLNFPGLSRAWTLGAGLGNLEKTGAAKTAAPVSR
jgi:hypothetical protein